VKSIAVQASEALFIKPLLGTITGALGFGQVAQGLGGGFPVFASGGALTVGGAGGTDSELVQFMATPGERVYVLTPEQQRQKDNLPHFATGGGLDSPSSPTSASVASAATQIAVNVNGLQNGSSIFGATLGGKVFDTGNVVTVQSSGSGGLFSGVGDFLRNATNNLGRTLGFASTGTGGANALSATELAELGVPGAKSLVPGSVFGATTLTQAAGAAGAGYAAGDLFLALATSSA
jgi:hypothetical protein